MLRTSRICPIINKVPDYLPLHTMDHNTPPHKQQAASLCLVSQLSAEFDGDHRAVFFNTLFAVSSLSPGLVTLSALVQYIPYDRITMKITLERLCAEGYLSAYGGTKKYYTLTGLGVSLCKRFDKLFAEM